MTKRAHGADDPLVPVRGKCLSHRHSPPVDAKFEER
jgi:hypothetical protein